MKKIMLKILCRITPIKRWRKGLRERYRTNFDRVFACCEIGDLEQYQKLGIKIYHPVGIVISKGINMGRNVTVYQNVTIGTKAGAHGESQRPTIGDNVTIFAGAVIVGDIVVGRNSMIGANSVVLKDVPENEIWAGVPARFIKKIRSECQHNLKEELNG